MRISKDTIFGLLSPVDFLSPKASALLRQAPELSSSHTPYTMLDSKVEATGGSLDPTYEKHKSIECSLHGSDHLVGQYSNEYLKIVRTCLIGCRALGLGVIRYLASS